MWLRNMRSTDFNSSYGQVVRASAYGAVDSGLIPRQVKAMTVKLVFITSLLGSQHQRDSVEDNRQIYLLHRWEKHPSGRTHLSVVDRRRATPNRARYSKLIAFS